MKDIQVIADRVEIEALRGEFTDAAMMRDRARLASLFTPDGALRMPNIVGADNLVHVMRPGVFVDRAADGSVSSDAVLVEIDRLG